MPREPKRKRSSNDIIADILKSALQGISRTRLMYNAYVSFYQFNNDYLPLLLDKNLLQYESKTKLYQTTKMGKEFLRKYELLKL